uniref:Uncharacterized protein n=1 Tax=Anguilla anguilla TaxID=7936 RepID=A0A0E9Y2I7_ANGAN
MEFYIKFNLPRFP